MLVLVALESSLVDLPLGYTDPLDEGPDLDPGALQILLLAGHGGREVLRGLVEDAPHGPVGAFGAQVAEVLGGYRERCVPRLGGDLREDGVHDGRAC